MNNKEFLDRIMQAYKSKNTYATGAFGAVVGLYNNRERYMKNSSSHIAKKIESAPDDTFLFDCIGLGKGVLYGWCCDTEKRYGGANYKGNGVDDFQIKKLENYCDFWSDNFTEEILPGEWLRTREKDHVGYYLGEGHVIEMTSAGNSVIRIIPLHLRDWEGHGTLKYIDYVYDTYHEKNPSIGQIVCPFCGSIIRLSEYDG